MRRVRDGLRPVLPRQITRFDTGTPLQFHGRQHRCAAGPYKSWKVGDPRDGRVRSSGRLPSNARPKPWPVTRNRKGIGVTRETGKKGKSYEERVTGRTNRRRRDGSQVRFISALTRIDTGACDRWRWRASAQPRLITLGVGTCDSFPRYQICPRS